MTQVIEPKAIQPISLPEISKRVSLSKILVTTDFSPESDRALAYALALARRYDARRSEEHTSELQSRGHLVCRLLLEKKKRPRFAISILPLPHRLARQLLVQHRAA